MVIVLIKIVLFIAVMKNHISCLLLGLAIRTREGEWKRGRGRGRRGRKRGGGGEEGRRGGTIGRGWGESLLLQGRSSSLSQAVEASLGHSWEELSLLLVFGGCLSLSALCLCNNSQNAPAIAPWTIPHVSCQDTAGWAPLQLQPFPLMVHFLEFWFLPRDNVLPFLHHYSGCWGTQRQTTPPLNLGSKRGI